MDAEGAEARPTDAHLQPLGKGPHPQVLLWYQASNISMLKNHTPRLQSFYILNICMYIIVIIS